MEQDGSCGVCTDSQIDPVTHFWQSCVPAMPEYLASRIWAVTQFGAPPAACIWKLSWCLIVESRVAEDPYQLSLNALEWLVRDFTRSGSQLFTISLPLGPRKPRGDVFHCTSRSSEVSHEGDLDRATHKPESIPQDTSQASLSPGLHC